MSLLKSAFTVGFFTLLSRILGFVRDIFIARALGAGMLSDVFFIAFKFPNFFRHLFAEGAFSAAFVPLMSGTLSKDGKDAAKQFAEKVFAVLLAAALIFTITIQIGMPFFMAGFAPGYMSNPEKFDLAVTLARITFPYLVCMALVSLLSGVLNTIGKFAAAASAPILLNLCLIASALWLVHYTQTPAHALSIGVAIAGCVQLLWLMANCHKHGMLPRLTLPRITPPINTLLKRMVPGIIGAGVMQINVLIDTIIATLIPSAVSYLYYADRISQFPLAIIGTAMGTALLPMLSTFREEHKSQEAISAQNRGLEFVLLLSIPAAIALMVLALPIMIIMFERGAFTHADSIASANALIAYAFGLPAFAMVKVLVPGFFAVGDTKTPVIIAIICLFVNLVLNLALIGPFGHVGLAAATTLSSWVNVALLSIILTRRALFSFDSQLLKRIPRMIFASLSMAALCAVCLYYSAPYFQSPNEWPRILAFSIISVIGLGCYAVLGALFRAYRLTELKQHFSR